MRSIRKLILAAVLALAMVAALALPAAAHDAHVVVFRGLAEIGDGVGGANDGLTFPGLSPGGTTVGWRFSAPDPLTGGGITLCESVHALPPGTDSCQIEAAGQLGEILGSAAPVKDTPTPLGLDLGPWCGISGGWGGTGDLSLDNSADTHDLNDVGWTTSAGSVLPVTGNVDRNQDGTNDGVLVALVQASGSNLALDCARLVNPNGAETFDVNGVAAAIGT